MMGWKVPVIVLIVLGLLGLAGWGISLHLDSLLEEHRRECLAIQQAFPVDTSPRPAILEPEEAGNVWELLVPSFAGIKEVDKTCDFSHFDGRDATAATVRRIAEAGPSFERCRRAAHRRDRAWRGPRDPDPRWASLTIRALSCKGLLLWQDGRDAEAAEWMLVALTVATDWAALHGNWGDQYVEESWVLRDLRDLLSKQSLSADQLEDFGRRLDLLRSLRVPFVQELRQSGALRRLTILEAKYYDSEEELTPDSADGQLSNMVGWRDFWSVKYAKVRILNDLRRCNSELEAIPWQDPKATLTEAERILNSYQGRFVHRKLPALGVFCMEEENLRTLDVLSAAVVCARFQALHGRLPKTWEEAGIPSRGISLGANGLFPPGSSHRDCQLRSDAEWPIGRRSGTK